MSIPEYIKQLHETKQALAEKEEFEVCAEIQELIDAIENQDVKCFIDIMFDIKTLKKTGFFDKKATYEQMAAKVTTYFILDNIFQYAVSEGMRCPYERYRCGIHDIIPKVDF